MEKRLKVGNRGGLNVREGKRYVLKLDSTVVTYSGKQADSGKVVYNTLTVPAEGRISIGFIRRNESMDSRGSKLKYPVAFGQSQREVFRKRLILTWS